MDNYFCRSFDTLKKLELTFRRVGYILRTNLEKIRKQLVSWIQIFKSIDIPKGIIDSNIMRVAWRSNKILNKYVQPVMDKRLKINFARSNC